MARKNRLFAKLASDVDTNGELQASGIQSEALDTGVTVYATRASLPSSGNTAGDQAYVTENNRLYIWNGSGWYNIALLNVAPSIQSVLDSDSGTTPFSLSSEGVVTTITITATDSDGDPITYAATADSDFSGLASLSQADNVFTITPFSSDSATTESGTITFTATDGVNIASSGVQTFTLNFIFPHWDETVLSIGTSSTNSLDNSTFIDRSTNAHTVTPTGTPVQTAFHPYLDNWSVEFDGAGDGLHFTGSGPADFGTGDFTLEMFVLVHTGEVGYSAMYNSRNSAQGTGAGFFFGLASGSRALMYYYGAVRIVDSNPLEAERWYHVALVRNSGTTTLYKDGVSVGTYSDSTNYTSTEAEIGEDGGFAYDFDGKISNCRIIKGSALYTSNFTPPTEKLTAVTNTTLLTCQSNRFIDNSSSSLTLEVIGTPKVSAFNPFGQESEYAAGENKGSILLNGTNNYLSLPSSSLYNFTGDFTIEAWVYINGNSPLDNGSTRTAIIVNTQQNSNGIAFQIGGNSSTTGINLNVEIRSGTNIGYSATATIPQQSWNHCVVVRSSGTLTFYLNGVNIGTSAVSTNIPAGALTVGYMGNTGYPRYLNGLISDIRIVNGTAVYTSNFTPPTAPVGNTNASLYLPMDNAGIFDKTGNHTLTLLGDVATSTTQTKFADTAMYFDGTGDGIQLPSESAKLGSGDFTIEFWVRYSSISGYITLAGYGYGPQSSNGWIIQTLNGDGKLRFYTTPSTVVATDTGSTINTDQWYHIAVVRSSGTVTIYRDGTSVGSGSSSVNYSDTSNLATFYVGGGSNTGFNNYYLNGYIENFQILKGVAKYTANFTPPTQEQGRQYQAES